MTELKNKIKCPLITVPKVPLCEPKELNELCEHISNNFVWSGKQTFKRGSITSPGQLDLCKQGIGVEGTEKLIQALHGNEYIKHILLGTDSLGDQGAHVLAKHIANNKSLETVYLGCNLITESGTSALAEALTYNTQIKSLWLKRNPIGNAGAKSLAKMLMKNTSLRTLDLVNTGIDHEGVNFIADSLATGAAPIQAIYLGGNQLDSKSIEGIISILNTPTLKGLYLDVNSLRNTFLEALLKHSPFDGKRVDLGLASNGIDSDGLKFLFEIGECIQFRHLDLGYARSTQVLGGHGNFFGDNLGDKWNTWLQSQPNLESLLLNKTGVGHNTLCKIIMAVKSHPKIHTLNLSKIKNRYLRKDLYDSLNLKVDFVDESNENCYLNDVAKIKSVYR